MGVLEEVTGQIKHKISLEGETEASRKTILLSSLSK